MSIYGLFVYFKRVIFKNYTKIIAYNYLNYLEKNLKYNIIKEIKKIKNYWHIVFSVLDCKYLTKENFMFRLINNNNNNNLNAYNMGFIFVVEKI